MKKDKPEKRVKTYAADDALDRERFGDLLYAFLRSEFILADESFVVALTGTFGSGKSHFLEMWENKIRTGGQPNPSIVHLNAWESDHSDEPVLAIVSAIGEQLGEQASVKKKAFNALKSSAARLALGGIQFVKDAALGYIEKKTGVDLKDEVEKITEHGSSGAMDKAALALFSEFEARQKALGGVRTALRELVGDCSELRLILMVDELDRCRPTYAIDFLEALKHLFDVRGIAVLLAVDWDQLCSTARALFGADLKVETYFRKFISRKVALPDSGIAGMRGHVARLWSRLFADERLGQCGRFTCAPKWIASSDVVIPILIGQGLKPRDVESVFRIISHYYQVEESRAGLAQIAQQYWVELFFLVAAFVGDSDLYRCLKTGESNPKQVFDAIFKATRGPYEQLQWSAEHVEAALIDAHLNKVNASAMRDAFKDTLSEEEFKSRTSQNAMPQFTTNIRRSEFSKFAEKLELLRGFAD